MVEGAVLKWQGERVRLSDLDPVGEPTARQLTETQDAAAQRLGSPTNSRATGQRRPENMILPKKINQQVNCFTYCPQKPA